MANFNTTVNILSKNLFFHLFCVASDMNRDSVMREKARSKWVKAFRSIEHVETLASRVVV